MISPYPLPAEINFTLLAEDLKGIKFSRVPVSIQLVDVNDNIPEFDQDLYQVIINENSPPGSVLTKVKASDADSGIFGTSGIRYTGMSGSIANE